MVLAEGDEVVAACHLAVVVHDLTDHARCVEPGHAGDIDRRFGVASALEGAVFAGEQRKDMARGLDVARGDLRIDGNGDGPRPVRR